MTKPLDCGEQICHGGFRRAIGAAGVVNEGRVCCDASTAAELADEAAPVAARRSYRTI
ncbi:hypothetical protein LL999_05770 [Burkholderia ambifaria]|uniref:hypothetical protein n=1 Tax=Burkholderia ambifaria TaxID=152480 RepID=UPI001E2A7F5A|nr:hypothetical protein [Burkholderia ambifaria]UEP22460.1 hypothetical protein LL999_05770 [Burkholderia ambifaria]